VGLEERRDFCFGWVAFLFVLVPPKMGWKRRKQSRDKVQPLDHRLFVCFQALIFTVWGWCFALTLLVGG
jgi:hypothetical protein